MAYRTQFISVGSYLPKKVLTNDDIAKIVETSDEWITERTGIKERHLAADNEFTSHLATEAAKQALDNAGMTIDQIDGIVLATTTPDRSMPATATQVQINLGMKHGFAFDIQAACSGFIYGLSVADAMIRSGQVKTLLLIGAETLARLADWTDRSTCVLFGDGAGAAVLQGQEVPDEVRPLGVVSTDLYSDGGGIELLYATGGLSMNHTPGGQAPGVLRMSGQDVFKTAVLRLGEAIDKLFKTQKITPKDIDFLVLHQANQRIIEATAKRLGMDPEKVIITIDRHANTSAASIPLALTEAVSKNRIKRGDTVLFAAMGGGFTWATALVRWSIH